METTYDMKKWMIRVVSFRNDVGCGCKFLETTCVSDGGERRRQTPRTRETGRVKTAGGCGKRCNRALGWAAVSAEGCARAGLLRPAWADLHRCHGTSFVCGLRCGWKVIGKDHMKTRGHTGCVRVFAGVKGILFGRSAYSTQRINRMGCRVA